MDEGGAGLGDDGAGVADLATPLGIKRRAVEEDLGLTDVLRVGVGEHGHHPGGCRVAVRALTHEHGLTLGVENRPIGLLTDHRLAGTGRLTSLGALSVHGRLEGLEVDGDAGLLGDLHGELDREPVGVVETEGHVTRDPPDPRGELLFQNGRPGGQGAEEPLLLTGHHVGDQPVLLGK